MDGTTKTLSIPRRNKTEVSYSYGTEESWLLNATRGYAEIAANRALAVECVLMLVRFQKFIVLCICAVLSQMGASKAMLVDITRICFGDISQEYKCYPPLADRCLFKPAGCRASELLLICKSPSVSKVCRC